MQKSTVRRGIIGGGVAGAAVIAALLAPGVANADTPDDVSRPVVVAPAVPLPDDAEGVLVTKDENGTVTVHRGQLPPGAVPALPIGPGAPAEPGVRLGQRPEVTIVQPDGPHVLVAPRPALPSTDSAG
ncbi:hypothetical protein [Nocardia crassostreae]|uniref:hypothetical protein n=1 Tax=Nocardia crassostreae TaxID=53428 RepID=UPI00082D4F1C|nr:hypothetical protein [Nocardia crassostreae]